VPVGAGPLEGRLLAGVGARLRSAVRRRPEEQGASSPEEEAAAGAGTLRPCRSFRAELPRLHRAFRSGEATRRSRPRGRTKAARRIASTSGRVRAEVGAYTAPMRAPFTSAVGVAAVRRRSVGFAAQSLPTTSCARATRCGGSAISTTRTPTSGRGSGLTTRSSRTRTGSIPATPFACSRGAAVAVRFLSRRPLLAPLAT